MEQEVKATALINQKLEIIDIKVHHADPSMLMAQKIIVETNYGTYTLLLKTNDLFEMFQAYETGESQQQVFNKILGRKLKEAIEADKPTLKIQGNSTDSESP